LYNLFIAGEGLMDSIIYFIHTSVSVSYFLFFWLKYKNRIRKRGLVCGICFGLLYGGLKIKANLLSHYIMKFDS